MSLILIIHNDGTGTETWGNYNITVAVNNRIIDHVRVEDHDRRDPWHVLVQKVVDAARQL